MAWAFGDGFDCYAAVTDMGAGYWDTQNSVPTFVAGRFAGSQAFRNPNSTGIWLVKSSAVNDAVHHITVACQQTTALSGTNLGYYFLLTDNVTNQCCVVFRSDGAILLQSGTVGGTTLATYTGAVTAANTWFAFEFEVIISNTVGRFRARKNGNVVDDFDSGATLNTRPGANSYANKLSIGSNTNTTTLSQTIDDILWRSDASSVSWVGDIRCYTRMPASDASVQFAKSPAVTFAQNNSSTSNPLSLTAGNIRALPVTVGYTGSLVSLTYNFSTALTGHAKMAIYDNTGPGPGPGALVAQSVELTNPGAGVNVFTVTGGLSVTKGTVYWLAIWNDAAFTGAGAFVGATANLALTYTTSFPASMAGFTSGSQQGVGSQGMNVVPINAALVNETLQDGTTSYVYDSTVGHADFYNIAAAASTPSSVVAVTVRGFMEKSDAGARTGNVQLKSGASTVASTTANLSTSWGWVWRTDITDPATGSAWTPAAVNNVQIGPSVVA